MWCRVVVAAGLAGIAAACKHHCAPWTTQTRSFHLSGSLAGSAMAQAVPRPPHTARIMLTGDVMLGRFPPPVAQRCRSIAAAADGHAGCKCAHHWLLRLLTPAAAGRGVDAILPQHVDPVLYESCVKDARTYVQASAEAQALLQTSLAECSSSSSSSIAWQRMTMLLWLPCSSWRWLPMGRCQLAGATRIPGALWCKTFRWAGAHGLAARLCRSPLAF